MGKGVKIMPKHYSEANDRLIKILQDIKPMNTRRKRSHIRKIKKRRIKNRVIRNVKITINNYNDCKVDKKDCQKILMPSFQLTNTKGGRYVRRQSLCD